MITLDRAKQHLGIDFEDKDPLIQSLVDAAKHRAYNIIGYELNTPDVDAAILDDVEAMYMGRGEGGADYNSTIGSYRSLTVYRQYSKRPMI